MNDLGTAITTASADLQPVITDPHSHFQGKAEGLVEPIDAILARPDISPRYRSFLEEARANMLAWYADRALVRDEKFQLGTFCEGDISKLAGTELDALAIQVSNEIDCQECCLAEYYWVLGEILDVRQQRYREEGGKNWEKYRDEKLRVGKTKAHRARMLREGYVSREQAGAERTLTGAYDKAKRKRNKPNSRKREGRHPAVVHSGSDYLEPASGIKLFNCQFQELEERAGIEMGSGDFILTDVEFGDEFCEQLPELGHFADRVLKDGRTFSTCYKINGIVELGRRLQPSLKYQGVIPGVWPGRGRILRGENIVRRWTANVIFSKGEWHHNEFVDLIEIRDRERKDYHEYQKPVTLMEILLEDFTEQGDLVVDCCAGSWTTALACYHLGRRCIACDVDATMMPVAEERFAKLKRDALDGVVDAIVHREG